MMTFIEGIEKGETDFLLGVDVPTRVYKAKFEKNDEDNFVLKFSVPESDDFNAEYFFSKPAVLFVPHKIQQFRITFHGNTVFDLRLDLQILLFPCLFKAQKALAELLAQIKAFLYRVDLLIFQLVELEDVGNEVGKTSGGSGYCAGVVQPSLLRKLRLLQKRAVILDDGQGRFQFMGYVGNEIGAQSLDPLEFPDHAVEVVDDDVEAGLSPPDMLDLHREVAVHDLFRSVKDAFDGTLYSMLAAQDVCESTKQTEQENVAKGHNGGQPYVVQRELHASVPLKKVHEKEHGTGEYEGDQQEKDSEQLPESTALLPPGIHHLITAL